ncbi:MAG: hypothetical protein IIA62_04875 [Nitrospinae bacterium]|nr:hypothetical protein [Nitrospinota bacterium]
MKTFQEIDIYEEAFEFQRIANRAVKRAQEENRKRGIPNVYSYNGKLYYELPNGELTREDPSGKVEKKIG